MSLNDYKITQGDIASKGVQAAPDVLSGSPEENKAIFDRLIKEAVAVQFNALIDKLVENGAEAILRRGDDSVLYLRLNADKVLEVSTDEKEYFSTVGSGHIIVDKYGKDMPKGLRLKFDNFEVREENGTIIVHGVAEEIAGAIPNTEKGAANGVATLDAEGKVPTVQLPKAMPPEKHADTHKVGGSDELTPEDIGAGRVNPNLLHNWYFANPVNQRGVAEYACTDSSPKYTVDRWYGIKGAVSVGDDSVHFVSQQTRDYKRFVHRTEITKTSGMSVTLSALMRVNAVGGTVYFRPSNGNDPSGISMKITSTTEDYELFTVSGIIASDCANRLSAEILCYDAETDYIDVNIKAIKLEIGTQQTLAHKDEDGKWVLNEIPDYGEQLALCQRYFQVVAVNSVLPAATTSNPADLRVMVPLTVAMRTTPTIISTASAWLVRPGGGADITHATGVVVMNMQGAFLTFTLTVEGLTKFSNYTVYNSSEITAFSADL